MKKSAIVKHYLEGWFIIDLVATVDWAWVLRMLPSSATGSLTAESPAIKLSRILKVLRLFRASRLINR